MLAFSNDYYGFIFRVTQSVELFCTYDEETEQEIYVEFSCSEGIDSGDYLKVKYLPYSRYGILLEKD